MWYKMKVPKNLIFMLMKPNLLKGNWKKYFVLYTCTVKECTTIECTTCIFIIIHYSILIRIN